MDEHEVELIEYLRVMWWGKWIIIGCFVIAVGLSALFLGLQPTTYSGSMGILLREYVTSALPGDREAMTDMASAVQSAVQSSLASTKNAVPSIGASLANDHITLSYSGTTSINAVREALTQAEVALEQQLPLALTEEFAHLATETQLQKRSLAAQLEILRQRLREEQATAEAPVSEALANRLAELEIQLAEQQVRLDTLETAKPGDLIGLSPIGGPTIAASVTNRKTSLAVAGFLGLFLGVLLAFFVHYLVTVRERERQRSVESKSP